MINIYVKIIKINRNKKMWFSINFVTNGWHFICKKFQLFIKYLRSDI